MTEAQKLLKALLGELPSSKKLLIEFDNGKILIEDKKIYMNNEPIEINNFEDETIQNIIEEINKDVLPNFIEEDIKLEEPLTYSRDIELSKEDLVARKE
jgi:hypothetical protein